MVGFLRVDCYLSPLKFQTFVHVIWILAIPGKRDVCCPDKSFAAYISAKKEEV